MTKDRLVRFLKSCGNVIAEDMFSELEGAVVVLALVLIAGVFYLLVTAMTSPESLTQNLASNLDPLSSNPDKWNPRS